MKDDELVDGGEVAEVALPVGVVTLPAEFGEEFDRIDDIRTATAMRTIRTTTGPTHTIQRNGRRDFGVAPCDIVASAVSHAAGVADATTAATGIGAGST